MELLFVTLIGAAIGAAVRYALPGRRSYGAILLPAMAAAVAAAAWAVLVWAGLRFDGSWIWVVSLLASGIAALVVALLLPRRRRDADQRLLQDLSRA